MSKVAVSHADGSDNTKSPVASKNDMGGDAGNIAQGGEEAGGKAPAVKDNPDSPKQEKAKLAPAPKPKASA